MRPQRRQARVSHELSTISGVRRPCPIDSPLLTVMMSSVGLDCMPSDLTVMLAVQKLREKSPSATPGHVVGALEVQGASGISGGTLNSIMEHVGKKKSTEDISESERKAGRISFLSKLPDGSYASLR